MHHILGIFLSLFLPLISIIVYFTVCLFYPYSSKIRFVFSRLSFLIFHVAAAWLFPYSFFILFLVCWFFARIISHFVRSTSSTLRPSLRDRVYLHIIYTFFLENLYFHSLSLPVPLLVWFLYLISDVFLSFWFIFFFISSSFNSLPTILVYHIGIPIHFRYSCIDTFTIHIHTSKPTSYILRCNQ